MPQLDRQLRKLLAGNDNALNIPSVNIGDGTFTPVQFTPQEYTPQQEDLTLLANSLNKMEERKEKLDTQRMAVAEAFSKAREVLPDNEETNAYITENQDRVMNDINSMIDLGDMSNALSVAKTSAAKFITSPEFVGRVKTHKQYQDWVSKLEKSGATQDVIDYYKFSHPDVPKFTYDENGRITGTETFKEAMPAKAVSPFDIIQTAAQTLMPTKTDEQSSGPKGGSHHTREAKSAKDISSQAINMVLDNSEWYNAFDDQFKASMYKLDVLGKQVNYGNMTPTTPEEQRLLDDYNNLKEKFSKNGAFYPNTKSYIESVFDEKNTAIQSAAYDWRANATRVGAEGGGSSSTAAPTSKPSNLDPGAIAEMLKSNGYNLDNGSSNKKGGSFISFTLNLTQPKSTGRNNLVAKKK